MKNLGFVGVAIAALAVSGCGGGGGSTPAAPAASATTAPPVAPATPGQVTVAYTTTFGVNGSAANANNIAFLAPTETATVTVAQANFTGPFTAASSCAQVTVTPASSATGAFTVSAADAASAGCTVTFTGNVAASTATLASTVARPSGVALRWYTPQSLIQSPPVPQSASPINLVGTGTTLAAVLAISENNYIGGFPAAKVVVSAGCTGFATVTLAATPPSPLPTAAPGNTVVYYTVSGAAALLVGTCTVTATDSYVPLAPGTPNPSAAIGVEITSSTGTGQ
jgi:hypothetical protein